MFSYDHFINIKVKKALKKSTFTVLALSFILTGCTMTPEQCDPSGDPSFFNKIGCVSSGSYKKRVTAKEEEIQRLKTEYNQLRKELSTMQSQESSLKKDISARKKQLNSLKQKINSSNLSVEKKEKIIESLKNYENNPSSENFNNMSKTMDEEWGDALFGGLEASDN